jgi:peptidylprolyl isomerase
MKKQRYLILPASLLMAGLLLFVGCSKGTTTTTTTTTTDNGIAKSGETVKVDYTLTVDGKVYDTSVGKTPFEFTLGTGAVIPGFENAVLGMKVGESKTVTIASADAYGPRDESNIFTIQPTQLPTTITPTVGMTLMSQNSDGSTISYVVTAIDDSGITIDGNSPLAGKDLTFEIKLIEIEAATTTPTIPTTVNPTTTTP